MATPLIGYDLKLIGKYIGGKINHWVGGLIHITFQTVVVSFIEVAR